MSRIGKLPIELPEGVNVTVDGNNLVTVKGKLGQLTQLVDTSIKVEVNENKVEFKRFSDEGSQRGKHGLYRALVNNMVIGVSKGYSTKQELVGVGYKAEVKGQILELALGFSHEIHFELPIEIKATAVTERRNNPIITLESIDKQLIGAIAAKIRSFRKPEPYKGKGIKFVGEELRRKAGKSASM